MELAGLAGHDEPTKRKLKLGGRGGGHHSSSRSTPTGAPYLGWESKTEQAESTRVVSSRHTSRALNKSVVVSATARSFSLSDLVAAMRRPAQSPRPPQHLRQHRQSKVSLVPLPQLELTEARRTSTHGKMALRSLFRLHKRFVESARSGIDTGRGTRGGERVSLRWRRERRASRAKLTKRGERLRSLKNFPLALKNHLSFDQLLQIHKHQAMHRRTLRKLKQRGAVPRQSRPADKEEDTGGDDGTGTPVAQVVLHQGSALPSCGAVGVDALDPQVSPGSSLLSGWAKVEYWATFLAERKEKSVRKTSVEQGTRSDAAGAQSDPQPQRRPSTAGIFASQREFEKRARRRRLVTKRTKLWIRPSARLPG